MRTSCVLIVLAASLTFEARADDWPWWRGPERNGVASVEQNPPTRWSETQNIVWKVPVPGRGHSSPTIVGNKIFLATADESRQVQTVMAFQRDNGDVLWKQDISQGGFPKTHPKNTHATCTVACDGERVFVAFHHHRKVVLTALDVEGNKLWEKTPGAFDPRQYEYGYAPSPLIYDDLVIIAADYEKGGFLAAYDRASGKQAWKTPRPRKLSFSSPALERIGGRDQLLISGCDLVSSYDPRNGRRIWAAPGTTMATCGTMVRHNDIVIASGGYPKPETIAVKADGSKRVLWRNKQKCYEQSMIVHNGFIYAITDRGIAYCWRATDGREMWKSRLKGPLSASPVLVGDTIYQANEMGTTFVFKANPARYEEVARNQLGDESFATQSICDGRIYTRVASRRGNGGRQEFLVAIGRDN